MEQINLSQSLVNQLLSVLKEHDRQCENELVASQYMAAVIGFIASRSISGLKDRKTFIAELSAFIQYVAHDIGKDAGHKSSEINDSAFGIWKPDNDG